MRLHTAKALGSAIALIAALTFVQTSPALADDRSANAGDLLKKNRLWVFLPPGTTATDDWIADSWVLSLHLPSRLEIELSEHEHPRNHICDTKDLLERMREIVETKDVKITKSLRAQRSLTVAYEISKGGQHLFAVESCLAKRPVACRATALKSPEELSLAWKVCSSLASLPR